MAYTRPTASTADNTWLGQGAYTRPTASGADGTWQPTSFVGVGAGVIGITGSGVAAHGVAGTGYGDVGLTGSGSGTHESDAVSGEATGSIPLAASGQAGHGVGGQGVGTLAVTAAGQAAHGASGFGVANVGVAAAGVALHERYELRGEVRDGGVLVNRRVRAYLRSTGALLGQADTIAGKFKVHAGFAAAECYVTPIDLADTATDWLPPTGNRITSVLAQDAA